MGHRSKAQGRDAARGEDAVARREVDPAPDSQAQPRRDREPDLQRGDACEVDAHVGGSHVRQEDRAVEPTQRRSDLCERADVEWTRADAYADRHANGERRREARFVPAPRDEPTAEAHPRAETEREPEQDAQGAWTCDCGEPGQGGAALGDGCVRGAESRAQAESERDRGRAPG